MIPTLRSCALLLLACALASCGDSGKDSAKQTAAGNSEILKGTINDDMIHYDTLRSQPPAAKIVEDDASRASGDAVTSGSDSGEASANPEDDGTPDAASVVNEQAPAVPTDQDD